MARELVVSVVRDAEAGMWVAISDDVPGLATEAATYEGVLAVAPELLRDNAAFVEDPGPEPVRLRFETVATLEHNAA